MKSIKNHISRRRFIKAGTLGLTVLATNVPVIRKSKKVKAVETQNDWEAKALEVIRKTDTIDLHSHLGLWETKGVADAGIFSYKGDHQIRKNIADMQEGGCRSAFVCLTSDMPILAMGQPGNKKRDFKQGEAWAEYKRQLNSLHELCEFLPIAIARSFEERDQIVKNKKIALFLSTEGGHMIEDDISKLEEMREDGIIKFQPVHYAKTYLGDSQSDPAYFGGLTPRGRSSIKLANKLKMIVDLAHASFQATKQAADLISNPIVISHTMMKYSSEKFGSYHYDFPRWISKDHAHLVASTGGVVGTWPLPYPLGARDQDAFIHAVFKMVDTIGINHVAWATDYIDSIMPTNPIFSTYRGFPKLCGRFLEKGFSNEDLAKFIGGNVARIYKEVNI